MKSTEPLSISPNQVPLNQSLTVRSELENFPANAYVITDERGRIIRKGFVSNRVTEFRLSMVGLATGVYRFTMGPVNERFTIVL